MQRMRLIGATLCLAAVGTAAWAELDKETKIRLEALEEQMADIKKGDEKQGTPVRVFYKDGLKFKSDDGNFDLSVGGRVIENGRFTTNESPVDNTFYNKETQVELKGKLFKRFKYEFEGTLSGSSSTMNNSFVECEMNERFGVKIGQFKEPILFEETTSTLWRDFPEKSIATRLAPARDIGIQIQGKFFEKALGYELGYFNGSGKNANDGNDDKDWAGRLTLSPWVNQKEHLLNKLQMFGFATRGTRDNTTPSNFSTTDTGLTFLTFNGSVREIDEFNRNGGGAVWAKGPLSFKGEFISQRVGLERNVSAFPGENQKANTRFDAWYMTLGYVLTGEDAVLGGRINPKKPFLKGGGYGAWELVGRLSGFQAGKDLNNIEENFLTAPPGTATGTGSATKMTAWQVGLNWTPISNAKTLLSYGENRYDGADRIGALGSDIRKKEQFVMFSAQFDF